MKTRLFHLHALSPLHVGIGQAVGVVDLPIMREKATNLPIVPGSALKGVMRDEFAGHDSQAMLFGPETVAANGKAHAGALAFGDALLLALPVRSLVGVSAFVTAPFLLTRYARAAQRAGVPGLPAVPHVAADKALVTATTALLHTGTMVLEDLDIAAGNNAAADAWAGVLADALRDDGFTEHFVARFAVVSDEVFGFLADTGTEIRARIAIDDARRTVRQGALWYEENIPAEALMFGVLAFDQARDGSGVADTGAVFEHHCGAERMIQIGGKATVGRGLVRFIL